MSNHVSFDRLETYSRKKSGNNNYEKEVRVSFETRQHGVVQFAFDGENIFSPPREPDLYSFTKGDRDYIRGVCCIVYRMVYDVPAKTERFRKS